MLGEVENPGLNGRGQGNSGGSNTNVSASIQDSFCGALELSIKKRSINIHQKMKKETKLDVRLKELRDADDTLQNRRGPDPSLVVLVGTQYELMDFLSRENSRVNSFLHIVWMSLVTASAASRRPSPALSTPNGLIFSASTTRAVSVASPTFSNTCLL